MKFWATRVGSNGYYAPTILNLVRSGPLEVKKMGSPPLESFHRHLRRKASGQHVLRYGRPNRSHRRILVQHRRHESRMTKVSVEERAQRGHRSLRLGSGTVSRITWASSRQNLGNGWLQTIAILRLTVIAERRRAYRRQRHYGTTACFGPEWSDESSKESSDGTKLMGTSMLAGRATTYALQMASAQYAGRWSSPTRMLDAEEYVTRAGTGWEFEEIPMRLRRSRHFRRS